MTVHCQVQNVCYCPCLSSAKLHEQYSHEERPAQTNINHHEAVGFSQEKKIARGHSLLGISRNMILKAWGGHYAERA